MTRCSYLSKKLHRFQNKEVSMEVRLGALKLYRKHLVEQYADRCAWWSLKDISGESMSRTMTIMTDGGRPSSLGQCFTLLQFDPFPPEI